MSLEVEEIPVPLKRHDSLFGDAEKVSHSKHHGSQVSWVRTLSLAFQSIGIIYGDIGTSPLYVYSSTFPNGIKNNDDLLGVLSLILYSLIIIPMLKYVFIVLYANDNGDGGTFALYSLISRYAKIRMIPDQQAEDAAVSNYHIEAPNSQLRRAQWVKQKLESSKAAKIVLFTLTILGTSMVIGDGTLTPAISGNDKANGDFNSIILCYKQCTKYFSLNEAVLIFRSWMCCSALCSERHQGKSTKPDSKYVKKV
jgi:KUP system potassium uptake protein